MLSLLKFDMPLPNVRNKAFDACSFAIAASMEDIEPVEVDA